MIRTSVYVGCSVDGFIARTDHRLDFLDTAEPVEGDMGFADFMSSIDVLVMGRTTFEVVLDPRERRPGAGLALPGPSGRGHVLE